MSNGQRIALVVGTLVVLIAAYFAFAPGDEDGGLSDDVATATTPAIRTTTAPATTTTAVPPGADHEPQVATIRVRSGAPVGGVQTIEVSKGDQARIRVTSQDTSDEIHIHGYDLMKDLSAPGSVTFAFEANAEGIFEIELEDAGVQIGKLVVEP